MNLPHSQDLHSPQRRLIDWQIEHADLNALIDAMSESDGPIDQLRLRRLKKRRLALRDAIARLHALMYPGDPA